MDIHEFRKSVTEMSDDELDEILNTTRNERAARKRPKKKKKKKKTSSQDVDFSNMTPEQARELLTKLSDE